MIFGADRMRRQRRHCRQHALTQHQQHEIKHAAQPGRSEGRGAEIADHDRVGEAHCHLRQIGDRERRRDGDSRADFRGYGRAVADHDRH